MRLRTAGLLLLPVLAALLAIALREDPPDAPVAVASGPPEAQREAPDAAGQVMADNLQAEERFWPYHVALRRPWQPAGRAQPLRPGTLGVLIRVEASGLARLDFGRDGLYEVPLDETDLLERANQIRRGELEKLTPNFVVAIGPRLLDPAAGPLRSFGVAAAAEQRGFLCVFADPRAETFPELARSLAPLQQRHGVLTLLLAQGEHPDAELRDRLLALEWKAPFVYDHLAESYATTLLAPDTPLPFLLLQTPEGRVLFQREWSAEVVPELASALAAGFGGTPAASAAPR